jgi:hypothetical protein
MSGESSVAGLKVSRRAGDMASWPNRQVLEVKTRSY